ncbi:protein of unknown function [Methylorubrum extorquens]|uniref:Uncharacterized protein n=1 Tax=Methylorubrum extorquens TaxID=408 RepID=A0A2N9ALI7_METEX|nr:protein of unknown function [Methylorubrum extorquens]
MLRASESSSRYALVSSWRHQTIRCGKTCHGPELSRMGQPSVISDTLVVIDCTNQMEA